jgi:hypothetical protein
MPDMRACWRERCEWGGGEVVGAGRGKKEREKRKMKNQRDSGRRTAGTDAP